MRLLLSLALLIIFGTAATPVFAQTEVNDWIEQKVARCSAKLINSTVHMTPDDSAETACSCVAHKIADGHDMRWIDNQPIDEDVYIQAKFAACGYRFSN